MKKIVISLIFMLTISFVGLGFSNPGGVAILSNADFITGFYVFIFSGLAGVGFFDLANWNESVSRN